MQAKLLTLLPNRKKSWILLQCKPMFLRWESFKNTLSHHWHTIIITIKTKYEKTKKKNTSFNLDKIGDKGKSLLNLKGFLQCADQKHRFVLSRITAKLKVIGSVDDKPGDRHVWSFTNDNAVTASVKEIKERIFWQLILPLLWTCLDTAISLLKMS